MKPMRVDKFIMRHIKSFPGKLKIAMATSANDTECRDEPSRDEDFKIKDELEDHGSEKNIEVDLDRKKTTVEDDTI